MGLNIRMGLRIHRRLHYHSFLCVLLLSVLLARTLYAIAYRQVVLDYSTQTTTIREGHLDSEYIVCPQSDQDVFVVLKTGSTELFKLQAVLDTVFRCIPNYAIFSDYAEEFHGEDLLDALADLNVDQLTGVEEIEFYLSMREKRQRGEPSIDMLSEDSELQDKESHLAWLLDKWKFLPMLRKSFEMKRASWYLFIEADTYLSWGNLLHWLPHLNSSLPMYAGREMWIADRPFGYGGSGFLVSNPAMQRYADYYDTLREEQIHDMTTSLLCGDLLVGDVFRDAGIPLTRAWPNLQGEVPQSVEKDEHKWCFPPVTHHHVSPEEVDSMWHFEQSYAQMGQIVEPIMYMDIFDRLIAPNLRPRMTDWNNMSNNKMERENDTQILDGVLPATRSLMIERRCRTSCQEAQACVQYAVDGDDCFLDETIRLGRGEKGFQSGFLLDRIYQQIASFGRCREPRWIET